MSRHNYPLLASGAPDGNITYSDTNLPQSKHTIINPSPFVDIIELTDSQGVLPEERSFDSHPAGVLQPPFIVRQPSHLPTPQSPHDFVHYANGSQASPIFMVQAPTRIKGAKSMHPLTDLNEDNLFNFSTHQTLTPEASPSRPFQDLPVQDITLHSSRNLSVASSSSVTLEALLPTPKTVLERAISPISATPPSLSTLSSPFMAKASPAKSKSPSQSPDYDANGVLFASSSTQHVSYGEDMDRIRAQLLEEKLSAQRELEKRRPDYLKRQKRSQLESDLSNHEFPELDDDVRDMPGVGITESPIKGRRLKLFQETSEESFEESLMAGGYGVYRTSDWQRPSFSVEPTPRPVSDEKRLEFHSEQAGPPSERELLKRKRLAAFMKEGSNARSKLVAVELEGRGRVIFDTSTSEECEPTPASETSPKKRSNRRKKKATEGSSVELQAKGKDSAQPQIQRTEQPGWPDQEFPWKLRTDERTELLKAEEEERLRCIERFLDRNTDDEDEENQGEGQLTRERVASIVSRGKTMHTSRNDLRVRQLSLWYQSNPADARAALLSRKSIRALQRRRSRRAGNGAGEIVCICNGQDDGRDLVQCDACKRWHHLECIGIASISDLGPEEDPWFCEDCVSSSTPPPATLLLPEPTFVPTDTAAVDGLPSDIPFFHMSQDSPVPLTNMWRPPTTPIRGEFASTTSTRSSWVESSRPGPTTPRQPSSVQSVKIWQSTPDDEQDQDVFDPHSTPSRGIQFTSFATPKNGNLWSSRTQSNSTFLQTPSKPGRGSRHAISRGEETLSSSSTFGHVPTYDDSPIRAGRSGDVLKPAARGVLDSPSSNRRSYSHGLSQIISQRRSEPSFASSITSDLRHTGQFS